jgi:hypothetical protein
LEDEEMSRADQDQSIEGVRTALLVRSGGWSDRYIDLLVTYICSILKICLDVGITEQRELNH